MELSSPFGRIFMQNGIMRGIYLTKNWQVTISGIRSPDDGHCLLRCAVWRNEEVLHLQIDNGSALKLRNPTRTIENPERHKHAVELTHQPEAIHDRLASRHRQANGGRILLHCAVASHPSDSCIEKNVLVDEGIEFKHSRPTACAEMGRRPPILRACACGGPGPRARISSQYWQPQNCQSIK